MTSVIIDSTAGAQLRNLWHLVEIRDDNGNLLGHFVPVLDPETRKKAEPTIAEEELRRREQGGGGRPLQDILADLEKKG